jgi:hypothetical protein
MHTNAIDFSCAGLRPPAADDMLTGTVLPTP